MFNKVQLYAYTLKYLKPKQFYSRGKYFFRKKYLGNAFKKIKAPEKLKSLALKNSINSNSSLISECRFTFLNKPKEFEDTSKIDWNYHGFGKLWCYNLNYFDFLHQEDISKADGINLILDYIAKKSLLKDGLEPYPVSLRNINWIKFITYNKINKKEIDDFIYSGYKHLTNNLEYHLMGNHLLENAFSLLFGAYYFQSHPFYLKAYKLLKNELNEQILSDGGHFELSPMYHQVILFRLLDSFNLISNNQWKNDDLKHFLLIKCQKMLGWLAKVTFKNGNIPCVNDSTHCIAPTSEELFNYARSLRINWKLGDLMDSGYRKININNYELFIDIGNIGPDYIPGHAHSDTFNFLLNVDNNPVIVDTGISTYEKNERRQYERSTSAHNTVMINGQEQSEVWGGFRVGRRAKILNVQENADTLSASHNGYQSMGVIHTREWTTENDKIIIVDRITKKNNKAKAFLHFHPETSIKIEHDTVKGKKFEVIFENAQNIIEKEYDFSLGFNKTIKAKKIQIKFHSLLKTTFIIKNESSLFNG